MIQKYLGIIAFFFIALFMTHMLQVVRIDFSKPLTKTEIILPENKLPLYQKNNKLVLPNRPNLVIFFSTKCKACDYEVLTLKKIVEKYTDLPPIIGIAVYSNAEELKTFFEKRNNPFDEIAIDETGELAKLVHLTDLPTMFIVDASQKAIFSTKGVLDIEFFETHILSKIKEISK